MPETIRLRSTSRASARGDDILLRETEKTRLVFRPQVVDNPHDAAASVKGVFIFQAKKPSDLWADYKTLDLTKLRDGEWVKLEIKSAELKTLFTELDSLYELGLLPDFPPFISRVGRVFRPPGAVVVAVL